MLRLFRQIEKMNVNSKLHSIIKKNSKKKKFLCRLYDWTTGRLMLKVSLIDYCLRFSFKRYSTSFASVHFLNHYIYGMFTMSTPQHSICFPIFVYPSNSICRLVCLSSNDDCAYYLYLRVIVPPNYNLTTKLSRIKWRIRSIVMFLKSNKLT